MRRVKDMDIPVLLTKSDAALMLMSFQNLKRGHQIVDRDYKILDRYIDILEEQVEIETVIE